MKRIQRLHLRNFKAFTDQVFDFTTPPERLDGQNILIYGNNGSGKSSLFWALYTFLQSAGKRPGEVAKYFVPLDEADTKTYQSLRHVFAAPDEESFVEITWADVPAAGTSAQRIGLDPPSQDDATGQERSILERTRQDPAKGRDTTIREANLGSDFIHYRYLQDFYQRSNREEVNVWPVFMRDLFPFYPTPLFIGDNGIPKMLGDVMRNLLQEGKSRERWHADPKREFEQRVATANQAIGQFVNSVETNANAFLHKYFLGDQNSLSVTLRYQGQLSFDLLRAAPDTAVEREWRNENDDLRIILSVEIRKPGKSPVTHFRPQSFLNEAQLTRIALAVRLGALLTRAQNSEMKLLCLDDLLISLDMANRKHVLDWLFGEGGRYCREYQIICLTHDRELYRMLRHYIAKPEAGEWKIFELVNNEYYPTPQPSLAALLRPRLSCLRQLSAERNRAAPQRHSAARRRIPIT
jgi:energy-coupling factor transporter ATP-binding protein EcfA2